MIRVLFIRHGKTRGNEEHRYIGRTDEPLSARGREQAQALHSLDFRPDRLFVSPMKRTRETASLAFPGILQESVEGLRELDFGLFENRTAEEMWEFPPYQTWVDSMGLLPIPQGESRDHFMERTVGAFLSTLRGHDPEREEALFCYVVHGGSIMAILSRLARPKRDFYDSQIKNGSWLLCRLGMDEKGLYLAEISVS